MGFLACDAEFMRRNMSHYMAGPTHLIHQIEEMKERKKISKSSGVSDDCDGLVYTATARQ